MRPVHLAALVVLVIAVAGCSDPYGRESSSPHVDGELPAPQARRAHERLHAERGPRVLIEHAVQLAGTWTSASVVERYARLVRLTVGAARRHAAESAARIGTDRQLTAPGSESRTTLKTLSLTGTGSRRSAIVVTHEWLRADGRVAARWRVTLATVVRARGGWALARWEPQP